MCLWQIIHRLCVGLTFGISFRILVAFAVLCSAALGVTLLTPFSPLHLLWILPASFILSVILGAASDARIGDLEPVPDVPDWEGKREFIGWRRRFLGWASLWFGSMILICAAVAYLLATRSDVKSLWIQLLPGAGVSLSCQRCFSRWSLPHAVFTAAFATRGLARAVRINSSYQKASAPRATRT